MQSALRERRVAAGLTQAELAGEAGVSRPQISAIEAGRNTPSVTAALALARALGAPVEELFPAEPLVAVPVVEAAPEGSPPGWVGWASGSSTQGSRIAAREPSYSQHPTPCCTRDGSESCRAPRRVGWSSWAAIPP